MRLKVFCAFLLQITAISLPAQTIKTVAGTTCGAYAGDGGPATSATLTEGYYCYPAFDNAGNMYFSEVDVNTIRKVDAVTGVITTIAGTLNLLGYTGDGGPATNALIYHPTALAVDDAGDIYISDQVGTAIRMINPAGIITTVSGSTVAGSCGVGDGGPLSGARFKAISAIVTDHNGNLYISDFGCDVIRKVNSAGIITTIAGNGTQGFSGDGGLATSAQLAYPCKVAVDNNGNIYIPDAQNHRIRRVDAVTGIITTVVGTGVSGYTGDGGLATAAEVSFPGSVVFDNAGNFYFGDYNMVIRKVDPSGIITTYVGNGSWGYTGDGGPAQNAEINLTEGRISVDNSGNIYFLNFTNCVIREVPTCSNPLSMNHTPVHTQLCNSGTATYNIVAGNATGYAWQVYNGGAWTPLSDNTIYAGSSSNQLTITASNTALNGNLYRCVATNTCGMLNSIPDTLSISTPAPPSISITTGFNTICSGTLVTFTATTTLGGTTPQYQWMKNGINVGSNAPTYSDNVLNDNDQISCMLTSNSTCVTTAQALSNNFPMFVNPALQATITISPSPLDICNGSNVNFTSVVNDAGPNPSYQWQKNGIPVGSNGPGYADATLTDGDQVSCVLTSSYTCPLSPSATSNTVIATVHSILTPSVTITGPGPVCPGTPVTFSALAVNGATVHYQWMKDGQPFGTDSTGLTDPAPKPGDAYSCTITATGNCLSSPTATSNTLPLNLFPAPGVSLDQNPLLCTNAYRLLDAGNFAAYAWDDGSSSETRLITDTGWYRVTITDKNGCSASDAVHIDAYAPPPAKFLPPDTTICMYESLTIRAKSGYANYIWNDSHSGPAITIKQPGLYFVEVTDENNCTGTDSILVGDKQCAVGFHIPSAFTPNGDGHNDLFRPLLYGDIVSYKFAIYNRWGQPVFESADPLKGWDGNFNGSPQDTNTFVWTCQYQLSGNPLKSERGTVVLIR